MYNSIIKKIKEYNNIVIARHKGVDPDALCGQLSLRDSIKLTFPEKKVIAVGTGSSKFTHFGRLDKLENLEDALLIVLDTPDRRRVDSVDVTNFSYSIKIDHHPFIEKFCDLEVIEDTKSSVCEIIMNLVFNTELKCNDDIAELMYLGLVSDSNRFLFNNCTAETFSTVSNLLAIYNIDLAKAYEKLYLRPLSEVRLEGFISLNMKVTENGVGYVIISDEDINRFGVDSASAGNMINDFNYIKEILVWVTVTEDKKNNQYRISIRSRGPEINKVAEKHNGGGHKMASGVKSPTLDEALLVIRDLDMELKEYNN